MLDSILIINIACQSISDEDFSPVRLKVNEVRDVALSLQPIRHY